MQTGGTQNWKGHTTVVVNPYWRFADSSVQTGTFVSVDKGTEHCHNQVAQRKESQAMKNGQTAACGKDATAAAATKDGKIANGQWSRVGNEDKMETSKPWLNTKAGKENENRKATGTSVKEETAPSKMYKESTKCPRLTNQRHSFLEEFVNTVNHFMDF